jgi:predicted enzyme related to lactoylglutathione lyase
MNPLIHLELHTADRAGASDLYARLLGWRSERIDAGASSYTTLGLGERCGGGIVECGAERAMWLPYVAVKRIHELTDRAGDLGATVVLGPRKGPSGWRSVVATPEGGEIAFFEPRENRAGR